MGYFEEHLHVASLHGIEFPIEERRVDRERDIARKLYPFRDGQTTEPTGRAPRKWEIDVPLFTGMRWTGSTPLFPDTYQALVALFADPDLQGEVEYVDPFDGPVSVILPKLSDVMKGTERDGVRLHFSIEERDDEAQLIRIRPENDPRGQADVHAEAVDAGFEDAGITEDEILDEFEAGGVPFDEDELDYDSGFLFESMVDGFFEGLDAGALAGDEIAARVDVFRTRLDRVLNFSATGEAENWSLHYSIMRLAESISAAGEKASKDAPTVVEYQVDSETSHVEVSTRRYGTPDRADEIARRNPIRNPLVYPAGYKFLVLSR